MGLESFGFWLLPLLVFIWFIERGELWGFNRYEV
jgi:hypothetical protein